MACHQAHNLPWNVLASNFKHVAAHRGVEHTNLFPRFKQHQGKEIQYFINAFCSNVTAHRRVELRKFGDEPQPSPDADISTDTQSDVPPDAILLTDETVERIKHSLHGCAEIDWYGDEPGLDWTTHFFGVPRGVYARYGYGPAPAAHLTDQYPSRERARFPYGVLPFGDFIHLEGPVPHQPSVPDVLRVRWCLCRLGLPTELATEVMDFAGYVPLRRLPVAHDPFHKANREELRRYLNYCWTVIVRTDMLGSWLGYDVPWDRLVAEELMQLVGYGPSTQVAYAHGRRFCTEEYDDECQGFRYHESYKYTFY
ncbi:Nitrogen assimilation transcription factor nit-4 [Verticillium dahliae VDG2]|nr:Nitrogen assimilation transcription factor nit-4 [Verticillium dahliae VDG2]